LQTLRRLAQNREAARKSRLRKKVHNAHFLAARKSFTVLYSETYHYRTLFNKLLLTKILSFEQAYVQQLESSRIKLTHMEQELQRARSQGLLLGAYGGASGNISSGEFKKQYAFRHLSRKA